MQKVRHTQILNHIPQDNASTAQSKNSIDKLAVTVVSLGSLMVIIPLTLLCTVIVVFQIFQLNFPGVFVFDKNVGMMNIDETSAWIDTNWNQDRQINLIDSENSGSSFWLTPQELGIWVDPEATANAAYHFGRSSDPLSDFAAALNGQPQIVLPVLFFDEGTARQTIERLAKDLASSPIDASVVYQENEWVAIPGAAGRTVNIDATIEDLFTNAFSILLSQSAMVQTQTITPALADLTPILNEIEVVVSQEYILQAYDPISDESLKWSIPDVVKRTLVSIDPETYSVSLSFEQDDVEALFDTWEADLGDGRSFDIQDDLGEILDRWADGSTPIIIIQHDPTNYLVSAGESLWSISLKLGMPLWYIMDANEGLTINNLEAGMNLVIPSKNVLLPLPVVPNKRIVIDISEQRMTVYENGEVRNTTVVSTGVSDSPTMAGIFQIQSHEINAYASNWDLWMPHFLGIYEAWPGFMNGIHGLPLLSSGQRLWASTLGSPASYGCIILNLSAAEDLYYWADPGVVVEITR